MRLLCVGSCSSCLYTIMSGLLFNVNRANASWRISCTGRQEYFVPFQRYPHDTLTTVQVAVRARRSICIYVASYFSPMAALARALDSFSPAVWDIVSHGDSMRLDKAHTRDETRWRHASKTRKTARRALDVKKCQDVEAVLTSGGCLTTDCATHPCTRPTLWP